MQRTTLEHPLGHRHQHHGSGSVTLRKYTHAATRSALRPAMGSLHFSTESVASGAVDVSYLHTGSLLASAASTYAGMPQYPIYPGMTWGTRSISRQPSRGSDMAPPAPSGEVRASSRRSSIADTALVV
jgi:hypothetical protein